MEKVAKEDLEKVAKRVLAKLSAREEGATLLTLSGDLGAGKTTLVQALARELGITEAIQSPTYVLMKRYELQGQLFDALIHIDAYRLENAEQFAALEPERVADPLTLQLSLALRAGEPYRVGRGLSALSTMTGMIDCLICAHHHAQPVARTVA